MNRAPLDLWSWTPSSDAPATPAREARIVRVLRVEDTREWVEGPDDRWHAVPGSGNARECSRCGRLHEIHAFVELDDGATAIVGTGCAARDSLELAAAFRSGENRAKRVKELTARIARQERLASELAAMRREVERLAVPEVQIVETGSTRGGEAAYEVRVGDGVCWALHSDLYPSTSRYGYEITYREERRRERVQCATSAWERKRLVERGWTYGHDAATQRLAELRKRLQRVEASTEAR